MYNGVWASQVALAIKEKPACQRRRPKRLGVVPGWEDPLEEGMATHSSILTWRIPWTEELVTRHRAARHAAVHEVTKSWTRLSEQQ